MKKNPPIKKVCKHISNLLIEEVLIESTPAFDDDDDDACFIDVARALVAPDLPS